MRAGRVVMTRQINGPPGHRDSACVPEALCNTLYLPVETNMTFDERLLLFGWLPQASVLDFVENQCVVSEQARKGEILALWTKASQAFKIKPPNTFETVSIQPVDRSRGGRLEVIAK